MLHSTGAFIALQNGFHAEVGAMSATNEPAKVLVHGMGRCAQRGFLTHTTPALRAAISADVVHDAEMVALLDGYYGRPFCPDSTVLPIINRLFRLYQRGARKAPHG